jgi:hypothetical protein
MTEFVDNHVIFAIDSASLRSTYHFCKYLDQLVAMEKLAYIPQLGTGFWEGKLEDVYMMDYNDFRKFIVSVTHIYAEFIYEQECFLVLNPRNSRKKGGYQGSLVGNWPNETTELLGKWKEVSYEEAQKNNAWTFGDNKYFICK